MRPDSGAVAAGILPSDEAFRLALEAAPAGMIVLDDRGRIALVNTKVEKLFGYEPAELIGEPIEILVPEGFRSRHPELREEFLDEAGTGAVGAGRDLFGRRKDGSELPIEVGLHPIRTSAGRFVLYSIADVTERKRAEQERERLLGQLRALKAQLEERVEARTAELRSSLREREVLLQEVHHRVKNNLQLISSLIGMQARALGQGPGRTELEECRGRIQTIALINEKLHQSQDYAQVPFSQYARSLAANVFNANGASPRGVALELHVEDVALAVDKAIPCGLILNELITNALKHAYPGERPGTLRVDLVRVGARSLRLSVSDDGVGLPAGFDVGTSGALGLHLVRMLAEQLGADLDVETTPGTSFSVSFALDE